MNDSRFADSRLEKIGSAAAGIAHDLNDQLNLIVNHLSRPVVAVKDLESACQAVRRCSTLTSSLLTYCRTTRITNQSLDPAKIARKFVSDFPVPPGIKVELDIPHSLPLIRANTVAVLRALTNIGVNACEAMAGTGTLRISASPQQIDITDSGHGIAPERLKRVFDPFFSTKGGTAGGLGLSIVRELMREMGGYVAVESEQGVGTRFSLRFRPA